MKIIIVDDSKTDAESTYKEIRDSFPNHKIEIYLNPKTFYSTEIAKGRITPSNTMIIITDVFMLGGYSNIKSLIKQLKRKHHSIIPLFKQNSQNLTSIPLVAYSKFIERFSQVVQQKVSNDDDRSYVNKALNSTLEFLEDNEIKLFNKPKQQEELIGYMKNIEAKRK